MNTNDKNLWGNIFKLEEIRTPFIILKEQAAILSRMTNGLLIGEILRRPSEQYFIIMLRIRVPALNNYTYSILEVRYPPHLYPLMIKDLTVTEGEIEECPSEAKFEDVLHRILSSETVMRVISTLLADLRTDEMLQNHS